MWLLVFFPAIFFFSTEITGCNDFFGSFLGSSERRTHVNATDFGDCESFACSGPQKGDVWLGPRLFVGKFLCVLRMPSCQREGGISCHAYHTIQACTHTHRSVGHALYEKNANKLELVFIVFAIHIHKSFRKTLKINTASFFAHAGFLCILFCLLTATLAYCRTFLIMHALWIGAGRGLLYFVFFYTMRCEFSVVELRRDAASNQENIRNSHADFYKACY
jgi:hypothetical protein